MYQEIQRIPASAGWLVASRARIAERRGRNVAVARKRLTLVYFGLRDGRPGPRHEQAQRDRMRDHCQV